MIDDGETGFHYKPGDIDDLNRTCSIISDNPDHTLEMGKRARSVYLEKYTPQKNLSLLTEIYEKAAELEKKLNRS